MVAVEGGAKAGAGNKMVDLTSYMKNMDISNHGRHGGRLVSRKDKHPSSKPFICYAWKDLELNQFITLEIQLSCSGENCTVEIEEIGGGAQAVVLSQALPRSWLSMDYYRRNIKLMRNNNGSNINDRDRDNYNDLQRLAARADCMKALSNQYGDSLREDTVVTKQYFKLPFRCDDINVRGGYHGTGYSEDIWPVLGRKRMVVRGTGYVERREEIGQVNILTINLVAEEKYQKRNDKTPKRKKLAAAFDSNDSDDDDGIFVDMRTFNNNAAGPLGGGGGIGIGSRSGYGGGGGGYHTTSGGFGGSGFSGGLGQARGRSNASARNHNRNSSTASNTNMSIADDDAMSFGADSTHNYSTPTNANGLNAGGFDDDDSVGDDL